MSSESQSLERSVLERKDRDELLTITAALGGKAPSRARKADIVDIILELAGVEPASGGSADQSAEQEPAPAPSGRGRRSGASGARSGGAKAGDQGEQDESEQDKGAQAPGDSSGAAEPSAGKQDDKGSGRSRSRSAESSGGDAERGAPSGAEPGSPTQDNNDGGTQGGRGDAQRGNGDEAEPANRRRRRRGRDRDRNDEQWQGEPVDVAGLLDLRDEGYGFLRLNSYLPSRDDVYVSVKQVRQFGLRKGDHVAGASRPASRSEKNPALLRIDTVNGAEPEAGRDRPRFDDLTPVHPDERLRLTLDSADATGRLLDLLVPIGKGQRALVVAPPRAGTTTVLRQVAASIEKSSPQTAVIVVLVDARPEEVTELRRSIGSADVVSSTFDRPAEEHLAMAELVIERAKRMVEGGDDVVVLFDGMSPVVRAYDHVASSGSAASSGEVDHGALHAAKVLFGAARNLEEGGSLTVVATAMAPRDSGAAERITDELMNAANAVVVLDGALAARQIFPAVDTARSFTRHADLLVGAENIEALHAARRRLVELDAAEGEGASVALLIEQFERFDDDEALLAELTGGT